MSLKDRLSQKSYLAQSVSAETHLYGPVSTANGNGVKSEAYEGLKVKIHNQLVASLKTVEIDALGPDEVTTISTRFLEQALDQENLPFSRWERDTLVKELTEEVLGLGPLEPLLHDPTVSDILINGSQNVYVERRGKLQKSSVRFRDDAHLMNIIDRIVSAVGRRVDEKSPMVDARLKDGSRFNAIIPPLSLDGPSVSIRKFKHDAGTLEKLLGWQAMTPEMAEMLKCAVAARLNIVIAGGTGAGKTTLLNSLSALISNDERIVTIEDSAELQLQQEHVVRLETRPPNVEGEGAIDARHLIINSLRMRPDRVIVGECRSGECLDMLQAMNTGHDGSLTTLHANTPRDALSRIETMCLMNPFSLPERTIRQITASAIHIIIQANRLQDGSRKVTSITEITGMEGDVVCMQEIFRFEQTGIDVEGQVIGQFITTGVRPRFSAICEAHGHPLPIDLFKPREPTNPSPLSMAETATETVPVGGQLLLRPGRSFPLPSGFPKSSDDINALQKRLLKDE